MPAAVRVCSPEDKQQKSLVRVGVHAGWDQWAPVGSLGQQLTGTPELGWAGKSEGASAYLAGIVRRLKES